MKSKKVLALLLALAMTASITACGSGESASEPTANTPEESGAASSAEAEGTAGLSAPGELPIVPEKTTISCYVQQVASGMTDVKTNTFTKELEEMTNVTLDMTVVPADGARERLNVMLVSDDYPEILLGPGFSNADLMKYGVQEKLIVPLNDLIEEHAVNLKERFSEVPTYQTDITAPDGNIYGIPSVDSGIVGHGAVGYKMWMNKKWLEKLNLKEPTTTEEFRAVLDAFKNGDPNGNGVADEIPLTGAIKTWAAEPYLYLLNAFDYYNNDTQLKLKDGKFSFCANTDGFKEGLKYIAGLFADGLIDPAAFTQTEQQMAAIGNNTDIAIAGAASCGHIGMFVGVNEVDRCSEYTCLFPLKGSNGYQGIPYTKNVHPSGAAFVITDKCKQPEVAIKWADLFSREDIAVRAQVGIKGTQWDDADPDKVGMDGKTTATRKYLQFSTSGEVAQTNDKWDWTMRLIEPNWKGTFQVDGDLYDPSNYEARLYQETIKLEPYAADVDEVPPFWLDEADSSRSAQIFTPLKDYITTSIVEFVTGKKDVDAGWAEYTAGLEKLGMKEYVEINQKAYDALSK